MQYNAIQCNTVQPNTALYMYMYVTSTQCMQCMDTDLYSAVVGYTYNKRLLPVHVMYMYMYVIMCTLYMYVYQ